MRIVGVIPARGGSKGIPGKNLVPLAGRPLIAYTIQAAKSSARLGRTIVSTDDAATASACRSMGAEVPFLRDPALALDDTPMVAVLTHAAEWLGKSGGDTPDALALLQPTSPLREPHHIDQAIALFESSAADCVVSVVEVPHAFRPTSVLREVGGRLEPFLDGPPPTRRQDKPGFLARNGPAVLVIRTTQLLTGALYGGVTVGYRMPPEASIDIDTPLDLALAEALLARRSNS